MFGIFAESPYLCTRKQAQMAESVDALVSNTSGATRAGSTPALGTQALQRTLVSQVLARVSLFLLLAVRTQNAVEKI